jgi:hypothetical protein
MADRSEPTTLEDVEQVRLTPGRGRLVAWAGFAFGSIVSVAANVLAERIPPVGALATWAPSAQAELGAAVWPIALLVSVELLSRVRWPRGIQWLLARFGGAGAVAVFSAFISYSHISAVLASWDYPALSAHVGPLVIDGLMAISGFALLAAAQAPADELGRSAQAVTTPEVDAEKADAARVPVPRAASVTKPAAKREVVTTLAEGAVRREAMFAYLDDHPDATGAELDRKFGTSNYGRTIVRAWKQRNARASGE